MVKMVKAVLVINIIPCSYYFQVEKYFLAVENGLLITIMSVIKITALASQLVNK